MAGEYQNPWASALDKLEDEELYKLSQDIIRKKGLRDKNELLRARIMLDGDIKNAINFGGDYDKMAEKVQFHMNEFNDTAWGTGKIGLLSESKNADVGLQSALTNLNRLNQELQGVGAEYSSNDENVQTIMADVQKYLGNLRKMKHNTLATMHEKGFKENIQILNSLNQFKQMYDVNPTDIMTPGPARQKQIQSGYGQNPWNIQLQNATTGSDDPALADKQAYIMAAKDRNLPEMQKRMYDIPSKGTGKPESFPFRGEKWSRAEQGYRNTDEGEKAYQEGTLQEYPGRKGIWYHTTPVSGESPADKESRIQNEQYDVNIRARQQDRQNIYNKTSDEGGLTDVFKQDLSAHPKKTAPVKLFLDENERKAEMDNIAQDIKMWFSGEKATGDNASHSTADWIQDTFVRAMKKKGATVHDGINAVRGHKNWAKLVGSGDRFKGFTGGELLNKAFNWKDMGTEEASGDQYFLNTLNEYLLLDAITGLSRDNSDLIKELGAPVDEEDFDKLLEELRGAK